MACNVNGGSGKTISNEEMPLVSVIIPCYNHGRFLPDATNSILRQSYARREVIVVDDGSTDHTREAARQFGGAALYVYQRNQGLAASRNTGIRESRGNLLLFLDADDWVSPDYLEHQVRAAALFPDASIFLSDVATIIDGPGIGLETPVSATPIDYPDEPVVPLEKLMLGSCPFIHSAVVRRSLIDRIGLFDEDLRASEDSDFWIRAAVAGAQFVRSGGGIAIYRRTRGSLTSRLGSLHRSRVRLVRKLRHNQEIVRRNLTSLVEMRLRSHRCDIWDRKLSFHTSLSLPSLAKFAYYLGLFALVDPGFPLFLYKYRPWNKNRAHGLLA